MLILAGVAKYGAGAPLLLVRKILSQKAAGNLRPKFNYGMRRLLYQNQHAGGRVPCVGLTPMAGGSTESGRKWRKSSAKSALWG
jgi:hypothetical protein